MDGMEMKIGIAKIIMISREINEYRKTNNS